MRTLAFLFVFAALTAVTTPFSAASATTPQSPIANCLTLAGDSDAAQTACISGFAAECIETTPNGDTTIGTIQCVDAERLQWEDVRASVIATLRANESPSQRMLPMRSPSIGGGRTRAARMKPQSTKAARCLASSPRNAYATPLQNTRCT